MFRNQWSLLSVVTALVLVPKLGADQNSDVKGKAVRQVFMECKTANWKGSAMASVSQDNNAGSKAERRVKLDCAAYLDWWNDNRRPSPFTIWRKGSQAGMPIPPDEWMKYLQYLPQLRAK